MKRMVFTFLVLIMFLTLGVRSDEVKASKISYLRAIPNHVKHESAEIKIMTNKTELLNKPIMVYAVYNSVVIGSAEVTLLVAQENITINFNKNIKANHEIEFFARTPDGDESISEKGKVERCISGNGYCTVGPLGLEGKNENIHGGTVSVKIGGKDYQGTINGDGSYKISFGEIRYVNDQVVEVHEYCNGGCELQSYSEKITEKLQGSLYAYGSKIDIYHNRAIISNINYFQNGGVEENLHIGILINGKSYYSKVVTISELNNGVTIPFESSYAVGTSVTSIWLENTQTGQIAYLSGELYSVKEESTDNTTTKNNRAIVNNDNKKEVATEPKRVVYKSTTKTLKRIGSKKRVFALDKDCTLKCKGYLYKVKTSDSKIVSIDYVDEEWGLIDICTKRYGKVTITAKNKYNKTIKWIIVVGKGHEFTILTGGNGFKASSLIKRITGKKKAKWISKNRRVCRGRKDRLYGYKKGTTKIIYKANGAKYEFKVHVRNRKAFINKAQNVLYNEVKYPNSLKILKIEVSPSGEAYLTITCTAYNSLLIRVKQYFYAYYNEKNEFCSNYSDPEPVKQ